MRWSPSIFNSHWLKKLLLQQEQIFVGVKYELLVDEI